MKKLLKILLPPFAGFSLYFLGVRYNPEYFDLNIGDIGSGGLAGFMAYYKFTLPLLFTVAVLTQLLIVIPIWNGVLNRSATRKWVAFISLILTCVLFAGGISYLIWDEPTGRHHLVVVFLFMLAVQLVYWFIDLFVLFLLE
ncbi:hypothetical protein HDF24_17260 [Mucilaginibacter sp. X4EP1]|uniref:hypothetical protein n=1 Tax=Mucilaginibacter sp. X4EP1 TaxID=2723092 RepID=UPI0021699516|nr:hypothetical protein [Mucilaginibacter sp. X4EP1]MCS3815761.1 hypothetical protein [Mucilaginibacter sp. X4EP1]